HSSYREDPWKRLEGTMKAVWAVVYGSRTEADRAAARVRAMHSKVSGRLSAPMGPFPKGTRYSALDPALLMWVHATLVDTALLVPLRPAIEVVYLVTASLMPPRLRREYGLAWDTPRATATRLSREWTRRVAMPLLPSRLRHVPASG